MLERNAPVQISRKFRTSNAARNAGRRPGRASTVAEAGSSEVRADYFLVFFAEAAIAAILRAFKTSSRRFRRRLISCCRSIIESVCLQKNGCAWREAAILPWMPGSGRPACSPRRKSAGIRARKPGLGPRTLHPAWTSSLRSPNIPDIRALRLIASRAHRSSRCCGTLSPRTARPLRRGLSRAASVRGPFSPPAKAGRFPKRRS